MPIYQLLNTIYLNKTTGCYEKIITINRRPDDKDLNNVIKTIKNEKLSSFKSFNDEYDKHCLYAFINPKTNEFIKQNEIDILFTILIDKNYTIQYQMTSLFNKNSTNTNHNLICFISKN
jgi:hypothetical protein